MNRRRFTTLGIAASIVPFQFKSNRAASQDLRLTILDLIDVEPSLIDEQYVRAFQIPSSASSVDQIRIVGMGFVLASGQDVDAVRDTSFRSVPEWYVGGNSSMSIGQPYEAGLGGQVIGDGVTAWYWDVENPNDSDDLWKQFGIGCTAVWSDRRLLMLWGCAALENPVPALFDLASSVHGSWDTSASSLVPSLGHVPMGMIVIDEGYIDPESKDSRPSRPAHRGGD